MTYAHILICSAALVAPACSKEGPPRQNHVALSTPIINDWKRLIAGAPVHALIDVTHDKGWIDHALIQRITFQTGIWIIDIEPGYSVFRIYPYLAEGDPQPDAFQGIVLRVNGELKVSDLSTAIKQRNPNIKIDAFDIFGKDISIQQFSRPH